MNVVPELVYSNFIGSYKVEIWKKLFVPEVQYWLTNYVYVWSVSGLGISGRKDDYQLALNEMLECLNFEIKQLQSKLDSLEYLSNAIKVERDAI